MCTQIKVRNEIIQNLSCLSDEGDLESFQIVEEGEVLTALYFMINSVRSIKDSTVEWPMTPPRS